MTDDDLELFLRKVAAQLERQAKATGGGYGELGGAVESRARARWLLRLLDGYVEGRRTRAPV